MDPDVWRLTNVTSESPEWIDAPWGAGRVQWLREDDEIQAGRWRARKGVDIPESSPTSELARNYTMLVLEGRVRVDIGGAGSVELGSGDSLSLAKGTVTTFSVLSDEYEEFFIHS
jgi:hypothetical protein